MENNKYTEPQQAEKLVLYGMCQQLAESEPYESEY